MQEIHPEVWIMVTGVLQGKSEGCGTSLHSTQIVLISSLADWDLGPIHTTDKN